MYSSNGIATSVNRSHCHFKSNTALFRNRFEIDEWMMEKLCDGHRDRCAVRLERERASCTVEAATIVRLSGDACIHTHEWQLLGLNMGLNGNF